MVDEGVEEEEEEGVEGVEVVEAEGVEGVGDSLISMSVTIRPQLCLHHGSHYLSLSLYQVC